MLWKKGLHQASHQSIAEVQKLTRGIFLNGPVNMPELKNASVIIIAVIICIAILSVPHEK